MRFTLWLALIAATWGSHANAAVTLVREHRLAQPRDQRIAFAMAVTPAQDVLSFIANPEGKWRFSRVRDWLDKQPHEDTITVPGLVLGERRDWNGPWAANVLVTPDGKFAICEASAYRSGGVGKEEIVSVVDLTSFRLLATLRGPEVPELRGTFRVFYLGASGDVIAEGHTPFPHRPGDDALRGGSQVKLAALSLPNLQVVQSCEYSEWVNTGKVERREGDGSCAELLSHESGAASLTAFKATWSRGEEAVTTRRPPPGCAFLGYSAHLSPDGKFEREVCIDSHRGFWGNPVVTKVVENVYLVKTGERLGEVNEPRTSVTSRFASAHDKGYLLVMEGGTHLSVYLISR